MQLRLKYIAKSSVLQPIGESMNKVISAFPGIGKTTLVQTNKKLH